MGFNGGKSLAIIGNTPVRDQMNDVVALHQFFRQRLGGKQVSAGPACGKNNNPSPYTAQNVIHGSVLKHQPVAMSPM